MSTGYEAAGIREGDVLAGKYRVDRILGVGGMGVVVAAHHLHLDDKVAIKFLLPDMLASNESVRRFAREARAAVKIKSEHVARVADVGTLDNGAPYMVMEYLEGEDLSSLIHRQGALAIDKAAEYVLQASEAIAEAHVLGIVHRDLKPANLFLSKRPDGSLSVKVLDFGISKMRVSPGQVPDASITRTSALMGSPLYMSPEQMQSSKDVDFRTDIWALGVILHELVTGQPPFEADTMPELVAKVLTSQPAPFSTTLTSAPAGFEAVVLRCLEKDRQRRYESVGQLAAALMPFAPPGARLSLERISGVMRSGGLAVSSLTALADSNSGSARSGADITARFGKGAQLLGAVVIAALLGFVALVTLRRDPVPKAEANVQLAHPVDTASSALPQPAAPIASEAASVAAPPAVFSLVSPARRAPGSAAAPKLVATSLTRAGSASSPGSGSTKPTDLPQKPLSAPAKTSAFDDRK